MAFPKCTALTGRLLAIVLLSSLALVGCNGDGTTTNPIDGPGLGDDPGELVEDPFEGALNSTLGYTPPDPSDRIDRLAEALGLDETQKEALAAAYAEFHEGIADLRSQVRSGDLTRDEAHELAAALRESFEAELQIILTPEQYELLQELREGRGGSGDGPGNGHGDGGDGPWASWHAWLVEVGADSTQIEAVIGALEIMHDGMQDIRSQMRDATLTKEEAKAAAEELRADFDAELQEILTPEQYEALQELRPDCRGRRNEK